jgi:TRAP-type C4-dicarboxylate transport system permease small subunit
VVASGFALLQIVLRDFFSTGIVWGDALLRYAVLWVAFLGAARATRDGSHIRIDLLRLILPPGASRVVTALADLSSAVVCGVLAWAGWGFVAMDASGGGRAFADIPAWVVELVFPLSFAFMALRFLVRVFRPRGAMPGGEEATSP